MSYERKIKDMKEFIKWLKNKEEFSGEEIDILYEIVTTIMNVFIRFKEEE